MPAQQENETVILGHSLFDRVLASVLTWLIPGAGYWLLGHRKRAVVLGVVLLGIFWFGELVLAADGNGRFMAVTYEVHPVFFFLEAGNGLSAVLANWIWGEAETEGLHAIKSMPRHLNLGILFCVVSGMLNILLVMNILDKQTWLRNGEKPAADEGEAE